MRRGGFSIIEIVITITILGILLALAVVSMNASQVNARDAERKADIEAIAIQFEGYYKNPMSGSSTMWGDQYFMSGGSYPGVEYLDNSGLTIITPEADPKIFRAPGVSVDQPPSIIKATNAVQTPTGVQPQPTTKTYVYQALTKTGAVCIDPFLATCVKFNLYYRLEKDDSIQMVTSKNQ
ncbi:prepilin-type N-terminal cleavage/methylation domain-containing protein [Candidatus Saccharibacteria bacterium TM7i]|nr:prepilin-type N-terminal cleavage/methylation domain-containing protein [Candidatus Saccharibacteria bacterium TM7i]